ncbi:MAG TPA: hypothetical protein VMV49_17890 [Candidatus Deferrimicrobium sp.]|nr:hypothetical protein [Candidatus Deferrimicrobium sp.]
MAMEKSIIQVLIKEFQDIFEFSIEEETVKQISFREYRFNIARFLLDRYDELGQLPLNHFIN